MSEWQEPKTTNEICDRWRLVGMRVGHGPRFHCWCGEDHGIRSEIAMLHLRHAEEMPEIKEQIRLIGASGRWPDPKPAKRYGIAPIIRLEVESLKLSVLHAFEEMVGSLDADISAAVEEYCTPENISSIIRRETEIAIDRAVKEEVDNFYRYGRGRQAVREAVRTALEERA